MKKIVLILVIFALIISCKSAKVNNETLINKFITNITVENLKKNLIIIASDEMQGRETGSEGQKKAGRYLISQYEAAGISFPNGATNFYQQVPAAFMNKSYNENLPDSENIWAFIEGSEKPNEVIVISAHYDHIGVEKNGEINNGADDDGSGTSAILEIALAFQKAKKAGHGPKRSLLFLHVTGEEHGLHGSRFYSENPLFPIKNTVANINIDMIGRRDYDHPNTNKYVYVIGANRLSTDLDKIVIEANKKTVNLDLDFKFNDPSDPNHFYERSDHYNFAKQGIPAVFLFNGVHDDYHKPTDEVSKIEFDALTQRTQLGFAIAWELSNRTDRIVVDKK
jgi:Zn-dependent M28 family amino/carboxypeptidase